MQNTDHHVPILDAVRGLAILLVLLIHIGGSMPAPIGITWKVISACARSCWIGVDLFFVLSGFLITGILYDTRHADKYFRTFYIRRFLRIAPLYYGFLFVILTMTGPLKIDWRGREWIYLLYLQNAHVMKAVNGTTLSPYITLDHLWSLAVEEQFYCVWPAVVFLVKDRIQLIRLAAVLMLGSTAVRLLMLFGHKSQWMIYTFTPARADALMMGSVLALLFRCDVALQQQLKRLAAVALPACIAALVLLALPTGGLEFSSSNVISFGYTIIALASTALIILSLTSIRFGMAINSRGLRWLGKYSYGIYVLHLPVMQLLLRQHFVTRFEDMYPYTWLKLLIVLSTASVAVGLAFFSFKFYESKCLRLKRCYPYTYSEAIVSSQDKRDAVVMYSK